MRQTSRPTKTQCLRYVTLFGETNRIEPNRIHVTRCFLKWPKWQYRVSFEHSRPPAKAQLTRMPLEKQNWTLRRLPLLWIRKRSLVGKAESWKSPRKMPNDASHEPLQLGGWLTRVGWLVLGFGPKCGWPCSLALPNSRRRRTEVRALLQFSSGIIPMKGWRLTKFAYEH